MINTVKELKEALNNFPDDMDVFCLFYGGGFDPRNATQHVLQKVETYDPWYGDHKLLGLHLHKFNQVIK